MTRRYYGSRSFRIYRQHRVLVAQANFIQGGCLLAFSMVHSIVDAAGSAVVLRLWAEHCRSISRQAPEPSLPEGSWDRKILDRIWLKEETLVHWQSWISKLGIWLVLTPQLRDKTNYHRGRPHCQFQNLG